MSLLLGNGATARTRVLQGRQGGRLVEGFACSIYKLARLVLFHALHWTLRLFDISSPFSTFHKSLIVLMANRTTKRQRTSTNGTLAPSVNLQRSHVVDFLPLLKDLPGDSLRNMLDIAAKRDSVIADLINAEHKRLFAPSQEIVDFGYLSKSAWKSINVDYCGMSGSKQYEFSGHAWREVKDCIETIETQCPAYASFGTNRSALETLRKIGKSICLSGDSDVVGHEVRNKFGDNTQFEDSMYKIAVTMTQEKDIIMKTELNSQLYELKKLADSYCVFEKLHKVIDTLEGRATEEDSKKDNGKGLGDSIDLDTSD